MDTVLDLFKKYKSWVVRFVVGAVLAVVLVYAAGMHAWLVGGLVAMLAGIASDFVEKQVDVQLDSYEKKRSAQSKNVSNENAEEAGQA